MPKKPKKMTAKKKAKLAKRRLEAEITGLFVTPDAVKLREFLAVDEKRDQFFTHKYKTVCHRHPLTGQEMLIKLSAFGYLVSLLDDALSKEDGGSMSWYACLEEVEAYPVEFERFVAEAKFGHRISLFKKRFAEPQQLARLPAAPLGASPLALLSSPLTARPISTLPSELFEGVSGLGLSLAMALDSKEVSQVKEVLASMKGEGQRKQLLRELHEEGLISLFCYASGLSRDWLSLMNQALQEKKGDVLFIALSFQLESILSVLRKCEGKGLAALHELVCDFAEAEDAPAHRTDLLAYYLEKREYAAYVTLFDDERECLRWWYQKQSDIKDAAKFAEAVAGKFPLEVRLVSFDVAEQNFLMRNFGRISRASTQEVGLLRDIADREKVCFDNAVSLFPEEQKLVSKSKPSLGVGGSVAPASTTNDEVKADDRAAVSCDTAVTLPVPQWDGDDSGWTEIGRDGKARVRPVYTAEPSVEMPEVVAPAIAVQAPTDEAKTDAASSGASAEPEPEATSDAKPKGAASAGAGSSKGKRKKPKPAARAIAAAAPAPAVESLSSYFLSFFTAQLLPWVDRRSAIVFFSYLTCMPDESLVLNPLKTVFNGSAEYVCGNAVSAAYYPNVLAGLNSPLFFSSPTCAYEVLVTIPKSEDGERFNMSAANAFLVELFSNGTYHLRFLASLSILSGAFFAQACKLEMDGSYGVRPSV